MSVNLAAMCAEIGDVDKAEHLMRSGIAILKAAFGSQHRSVTTPMCLWAEFLVRYRNDTSGALSVLQEVSTNAQSRTPPDVPTIARVQMKLGEL